jgi:hypothetical protein
MSTSYFKYAALSLALEQLVNMVLVFSGLSETEIGAAYVSLTAFSVALVVIGFGFLVAGLCLKSR